MPLSRLVAMVVGIVSEVTTHLLEALEGVVARGAVLLKTLSSEVNERMRFTLPRPPRLSLAVRCSGGNAASELYASVVL